MTPLQCREFFERARWKLRERSHPRMILSFRDRLVENVKRRVSKIDATKAMGAADAILTENEV